MSGFRFRGARALVTGASSGIGADLAVQLARRGARVALSARREQLLEEVAERCRKAGTDSYVLPCDLGDLDAATSLGHDAIAALGGLDLLVNNAGSPRRVHAARLTFAQIEETTRVDYLGAMALTFAVLPAMLAQNAGRIVNVSSIAGRLPAPRELAYAGAKAALTMASEVLAEDLHGTGVRVHVVTPAVIDTPLWQVEGQEVSPFHGRPVPVSAVTKAIIGALASGRFEAVVPRRYRFAILTRALLGERFLKSSARYDRRNAPEAYEDQASSAAKPSRQDG